MDDRRFDELARALAVRGSRRGFLAGLAALAAGIASPGRGAAACLPEQVSRRGQCLCKTTGRPPGADGSCPCPNGQTRCGAVCVDLVRDPHHCGACDAACSAADPCTKSACRRGACAASPVPDNRPGACPGGQACCGGFCTDRAGDPLNCGTCGRSCDDADLCTIDACDGGTCRSTLAVDCSQPPDVCHLAGACSPGAGACDYPANPGAPCGGASCVGDQLSAQGVCDGGGLCQPGALSSCAAYTCRDGACLTSCAADGDCAADHHCDSGTCRAHLVDGEVCDRDAQCRSGECSADHYCCNEECAGHCATCDGGVCGYFRPGLPSTCGGAGACAGYCTGGPDCFYPGAETRCGGGVCPAENQAIERVCDGAGGCVDLLPPRDCGLYRCASGVCETSCASHADCVGPAYCDGGVCRGDLETGASCSANEQCLSGHCVGGVCCRQSCPAPFAGGATCSGDGLTCGFACNGGYFTCGDSCCPNGRACCDGVCCGEGGECVAGECSVTCRALHAECGSVDQCCLDPHVACDFEDPPGSSTCCHMPGGFCSSDISDRNGCCAVPDLDRPGLFNWVDCSPEVDGFGICGGPDAPCRADNTCISGSCCFFRCCPVGQACADDVCKTGAGGACAEPTDCASGLCCGGQCVDPDDDHCASCTDRCPPEQTCAGGQCKKRLGQLCQDAAECADGACYGICCDECGGLCGLPQPENMPCGGGGGRFCCSGACVRVEPTDYSCGGCAVTCPAGDVCDTRRHSCTCLESSVCGAPGSGTGLDRKTCRNNAGLCVTGTDGELACVWESQLSCADTCTTAADCSGTICVTTNPPTCTSDWVCTASTCCSGKICAPTLPNGRPL